MRMWSWSEQQKNPLKVEIGPTQNRFLKSSVLTWCSSIDFVIAILHKRDRFVYVVSSCWRGRDTAEPCHIV